MEEKRIHPIHFTFFCPHCGSSQTKYVKKRVGAFEHLISLLVIPFAIVGIILAICLLIVILGVIEYFKIDISEENIYYIFSSFFLPLSAFSWLGSYLAKKLIQQNRKKSNLSQITCQCTTCKKIFIPTIAEVENSNIDSNLLSEVLDDDSDKEIIVNSSADNLNFSEHIATDSEDCPIPEASALPEGKTHSFIIKNLVLTSAKIFGVVKKHHQSSSGFVAVFSRFAGKAVKAVYFLGLAALLLNLPFIIYTISGHIDFLPFVIFFIFLYFLFRIIFISICAAKSHSLKTLVDTENIKYVNVFIKHIETDGSRLVYGPHLILDKDERNIVAYDDVLLAHVDTSNKRENDLITLVVYCVDGRKHKLAVDEIEINELRKRFTNAIWEITPENVRIWKEKSKIFKEKLKEKRKLQNI